MSDLIEKLRDNFQDKDYRNEYAEECLNTMVATQIKVLREQREMTQGELAEYTGMRQPRIPLLEDSNYSNWTINTLKRFARAFDVALSVKFETFSTVVRDFENLSRESLQRPKFADDLDFHRPRVASRRRFRLRRRPHGRRRGVVLDFASYVDHLGKTNSVAAKMPSASVGEELASGPVTGRSDIAGGGQALQGGSYAGY